MAMEIKESAANANFKVSAAIFDIYPHHFADCAALAFRFCHSHMPRGSGFFALGVISARARLLLLP
jgi:hypothetical protein